MSTSSLRTEHIRRDYQLLSQQATVTLSDDGHRITIHNFSYPEGWQPQTGELLIRYPVHYPRMQPAIYIPRDMRYAGRVRHLVPATDLEDWYRWCTHYLDWERWTTYSRRKDTRPLLHFIWLIRESLKQPARSNPIEHADPRT